MKKILFEEDNPTITIDDLHSHDYVGLLNNNGYRSFLLNTSHIVHVSSTLMIIDEQEVKDGVVLPHRNDNIKSYYKNSDYTLYMFETQDHLMRWVYYMDEK